MTPHLANPPNVLRAALGLLLLILPGLYLAIALSLALPLLVERELGVLDALTTSLKIVNAIWKSDLVPSTINEK